MRLFREQLGSTMGYTILIILVVVTVSVGLWSINMTDAFQVDNDKLQVQAYQYAQSGVNIAVGLIIDEYVKKGNTDFLNDGSPHHYYGDIGSSFVTEEPDDYSIEIKITRTDENYDIVTKGFAKRMGESGVSQRANSISYVISLANMDRMAAANNGEGGNPISLFAENDLSLSGNSKIYGTVATNSTAIDSVDFGSGKTNIIEGDLYLGPGATADDVIRVSGNKNHEEIVSGNIFDLSKPREYPLPVFPDFPDNLDDKGDFDSGLISEDGHYNSISNNGNSTIEIDIGGENRILRVNTLDIQGNIELKNVGENGKLILYIEDYFNLKGNNSINDGGDINDIYLYYKGNSRISLNGNTLFVGSIFLENAGLDLGGSNEIIGNIISNTKDEIKISGDASSNTRIVYAPEASLSMNVNKKGGLTGTAVVKSAELIGSSRIYNDVPDLTFFNSLDWGDSDPPSLLTDGEQSTNWRSYGRRQGGTDG